jgi:hypothetical protein
LLEERGVEERGDHFETKAAPQIASPLRRRAIKILRSLLLATT